MAIFSIWETDSETAMEIDLHQGTDPPRFSFPGTTPRKVLEFEAASWNEACQRQYDHYGWGEYKPSDPGWPEITE